MLQTAHSFEDQLDFITANFNTLRVGDRSIFISGTALNHIFESKELYEVGIVKHQQAIISLYCDSHTVYIVKHPDQATGVFDKERIMRTMPKDGRPKVRGHRYQIREDVDYLIDADSLELRFIPAANSKHYNDEVSAVVMNKISPNVIWGLRGNNRNRPHLIYPKKRLAEWSMNNVYVLYKKKDDSRIEIPYGEQLPQSILLEPGDRIFRFNDEEIERLFYHFI
jgi:hypothetical protein